MKLRYLGHSSFALTSNSGTTAITDPYEGSIGFAMPPVSAQAVTLSHHHYDHCNVSAVHGSPVVFDKAQRTCVGDIAIEGIGSYHDNCKGKMRGENVIFKLNVDGVVFCHLGDLGEEISPPLVSATGAVDVLLIPVGGTYTIDALTAKKYVEAIKPKIVIPMHFKTEDLTLDIDGADRFLSLFDGGQIERGGNEITLSRGDICGLNGKIIVMERK